MAPSFAPVGGLSIVCGSWISAHFRNPLILLFIEIPMNMFPQKVSRLERSIGRECHDHERDKNRNDEGWNKPGLHCAFLSLSCEVFGRRARHWLARRFASASCAAVSRAAIRSYPDRAWWRWMPSELVAANRNQAHAST